MTSKETREVVTASMPKVSPKDPETGLNDLSLGTLLREARESAAETVLSFRRGNTNGGDLVAVAVNSTLEAAAAAIRALDTEAR